MTLTPEERKKRRAVTDKAWREANKERKAVRDKAWREANKEKQAAAVKAWKEANRGRVVATRNAWYEANKERKAATNKAWYEANKERKSALEILYQKQRRQTDPVFRLMGNLRVRTYHALRGKLKASTTQALLGCTWEQARAHIEAQFRPGMTWENHGNKGWHVDHIRPLASFDLTDPEQQKQAFHHTNLQPLWAHENLSKGAKFEQPNTG